MNEVAQGKRGSLGLTLLFSLTLFLSAALMFTVQPMVGKMLLPQFGGAPSVWLAAMAYFQTALLAGYFLAFLLSSFSPHKQLGLIIGLLLLGFVVQPLVMTQTVGAGDPPWGIVVILAINMSLPFLAISSLSPSLQRLFACRSPNPYFLFAASNFGSFIGLLAYPFLLERSLGLSLQADLWRWAYGALIVLCIGCWLAVKRGTPIQAQSEVAQSAPTQSKPTWRQKALWVFLAFVPSSLMMGVTSRVTMDTGAVPLFWVLPLALYLLTMVRAFAEKDGRATIETLLPYQVGLSLLVIAPLHNTFSYHSLFGVFMLLAVFAIAARTFHAYLAMTRPSANHLTEYYLWLALGGALGGITSTFLVPWLFPSSGEFTVVLLGGLLFLLHRFKKEWREPVSMIIAALILATVLIGVLFGNEGTRLLGFIEILLLAGIAFFSVMPSVLGLVVLSVGFVAVSGQTSGALEVRRNFFGIMKVTEYTQDARTIRRLVHGTTVHGTQQVGPEIKTDVTSYYGPLGSVLDAAAAKKVGMIGFGVGTSLCHTAPDRHFTVYEIDPDVIALADRWFDFMKACGRPTFKIGDGRKMLQADQDAAYDVLIIDAFSSDAIPVHLLTKEALLVYLDKLEDKGVLAFHISNRFYDLKPQLAAMTRTLGLRGLFKLDRPDKNNESLLTESHWVLMTRDGGPLEALQKKGWEPLPDFDMRVWTDDLSDALSALRINLIKN